jgi:hypothetical protein
VNSVIVLKIRDVYDNVYVKYIVRPMLSYNIKKQMLRDYIYINRNEKRDFNSRGRRFSYAQM